MPAARHYDAILAPVITEKATVLSEQNKVVFKVAMDSTKDEIAAAIETLFKVNVTNVNTMIGAVYNTDDVMSVYKTISTELSCSTKQMTFGWTGLMPKMLR